MIEKQGANRLRAHFGPLLTGVNNVERCRADKAGKNKSLAIQSTWIAPFERMLNVRHRDAA